MIIEETTKKGLPKPTFHTRQGGIEVVFQRSSVQSNEDRQFVQQELPQEQQELTQKQQELPQEQQELTQKQQELQQELKQELQQELKKQSLYSEILKCLIVASLSRQDISTELRQKKVSGQLNKVIRKLIADKLIEHTIPEVPNHPSQKFKITTYGKVFLELLVN